MAEKYSVIVTVSFIVEAKSAAHAEVEVRDKVDVWLGPAQAGYGYPRYDVRVEPVDDRYDH
jgi:hypothetical protein